ncbi:MAG: orotidine-5'-phosphate decarboxylase [Bacteroidota bacterium]
MTTDALVQQIRSKKSFLCVGLDTDLEKIPPHLLKQDDPIFAFNKAIIDATHDLCVAYKPNTAFYEAYGTEGWHSLEKTVDYINTNYPEQFTIADAKRGDIGNTASRYAKSFFETMAFDAITVAPYMGKDSVEPFLDFRDKHAIVLALTSNAGAFDFQTKVLEEEALYKSVIRTCLGYQNAQNLMFVVGATKANFLSEIREIAPDSFFLVPGVGAQGGSLAEVCQYGLNENIGLLVNSSRGIIYASKGQDFDQKARESALAIQREMSEILGSKQLA